MRKEIKREGRESARGAFAGLVRCRMHGVLRGVEVHSPEGKVNVACIREVLPELGVGFREGKREEDWLPGRETLTGSMRCRVSRVLMRIPD